MKRHSSQLAIWFFAGTVLITGCNKKKAATVPPQATAPTISTTSPATQPTQPATTNQPIVIIAPSAPPNTNAGATKPKTKPKSRPTHAHKNVPGNPPASSATATGKETNTTTAVVASPPAPIASPSPNTTANNTPGKTIIREGGAADPVPGAILPGTDHNEAAQQRHATEQLLQSTDDALKTINRPLNDDERAMVDQIRNYMIQARAATTDGDFTRANNLAVKAHLLSDALVKH